MTDINNYFLYFTTANEKQSEQWGGWQIEASSSLVVNDIIDFRELNEHMLKTLLDDFNTSQFLIVKRVFIHDTFNEDTKGVFNLYLEPVSTKNNPNSTDENCIFNIDSFFKNISGLDEFLKSMRPKGYFGMSPQNQKDLDEQYEMIEKLRQIREFVVINYEKNKEIID